MDDALTLDAASDGGAAEPVARGPAHVGAPRIGPDAVHGAAPRTTAEGADGHDAAPAIAVDGGEGGGGGGGAPGRAPRVTRAASRRTHHAGGAPLTVAVIADAAELA